MINYCTLGKFVATFGLKGELVMVHHLGKKTALKGLEVLFVEVRKDELLPYFIQEVRIKNDQELFVKLEGIDSKETAHKLTQKQLWLPDTEFQKYAGKSAPVGLLGYLLINEGEELGEILEVIEQPHQVLCRLEIKGKEVLIPLHAETLEKVDKKKKQVHVTLPDGLLELYL